MWIIIATVVAIAIVGWYFMSPSSKLHTLKDKRVLVTGASGGIGEQIAYQYAKLGANVVVTARRQQQLTKVTDKCATLSSSENAKFFSVLADMSVLKDTKRVIEESMTLMGGLDILVLNHITGFDVEKYEGTQKALDKFDFDMDVNFRSYVHLATHALEELKANNGSIIVINSLIGKMISPGMLSYASCKHALNGFFHSLVNDMRAFGGNVSVTVCSLGLTASDSFLQKSRQHFGDSDFWMKASAQTPEKSAYDVVEAGARRVDRMFTPYLSGRLMTLIYAVWPTPLEYLTTKMMASMQNVGS